MAEARRPTPAQVPHSHAQRSGEEDTCARGSTAQGCRDWAVTTARVTTAARRPLRVRLTNDGGAECVGQQRQPVVVGLLQGVHRPGPGPRVQQQPLQFAQHLQPALPLALAVRQQQHGARGGRHGQLGGRHLRVGWGGTQAGGQSAGSQLSFLPSLCPSLMPCSTSWACPAQCQALSGSR